MGKGKKLLILLLVAALIVGGYFAAQHFMNKDTADTSEENETPSVPIRAMQTDDVTGVLYVCGDDTIELVRENEKWFLQSDRNFPVKQAYADTMAADAANLNALRLISESADDFEEYGLKTPDTAYVFTLTDGSQVTYYIGNYNSFGGTYYLNVAGTEKIYLVSGDFIDDFGHDLHELADVEEMKTVPTEEIHGLTLTLDGAATRLIHDENGLKTVYSDIFTWFLDEQTPADAAAALDLAGKAASFTENGCADYKADAQALASFGLDAPALTAVFEYIESEEKETGETDDDGEPVTETVTHEETMTLSVGGASGDGSLYAKTDTSDVVYLIDAEYLQTLREFDMESLRNKRVCAVKSTDIESMNVTIGGKTSTITCTRNKTESGESEVTYLLDGKQISADRFETFFASVQSVNAEAFADANTRTQEPEILVTFHLSRTGFETVTLRLTPYNQNFYMDDNGALVNKRDAEKIIKTFESIGEK